MEKLKIRCLPKVEPFSEKVHHLKKLKKFEGGKSETSVLPKYESLAFPP
jgi:hypothetical protein